MSLQNYERIYDYIHEYQRLVYEVYSKHAIAFLTTYYHIDVQETIWDNEKLMGGAYERIGELSGIMFHKILLLPVFFSEEITTMFDGQEIGYVKEGETSLVVPSTYNFIPLPGDKVKLEQAFLRKVNDIYPIYTITGIEKSTNTDLVFYKLKAKVEQSVTEEQLQNQVSGVYSFFEYSKKIHTLENAQKMAELLRRNAVLRSRIKQSFYDDNSGFYFL